MKQFCQLCKINYDNFDEHLKVSDHLEKLKTLDYLYYPRNSNYYAPNSSPFGSEKKQFITQTIFQEKELK